MSKLRLAMSLGGILLAGAVLAQDQPISLSYKFTSGRTVVYDMTGSGTIPMTMSVGQATGQAGAGGIAMDINMNMDIRMQQACRTVNPDGSGQIDVTIPYMEVHSQVEAANQPIDSTMTWDKGQLSISVNGEQQPTGNNTQKLVQALSATMNLVMYPDGRSKPDPQTAKMMAGVFNVSGMPGMDMGQLGALTSGLPSHPVSVGDTWTRSGQLQMGGGSLTGSSKMKLAALTNYKGVPCARIEGQAHFTSKGPIVEPSTTGMPGQTTISSMDMTLSFVNYLDLARGELADSTMDLTQNADLSVNVQGMQMPASIQKAQMHIEISRQ